MTRRGLFATLIGGFVAALRPVPRFTYKNYSASFTLPLDAANRVAIDRIMPGVVDNMFKSAPLIAWLKAHESPTSVQWGFDE